jgi:hypothetical protein
MTDTITILRATVQQALMALQFANTGNRSPKIIGPSITALSTALEQPEQEPVAYYHPHKGFYWAKPTHISAPTVVDVPPVPLYVKWIAAQRQWQGLTDEDWAAIGDMPDAFDQGVAWAAARLKERNT